MSSSEKVLKKSEQKLRISNNLHSTGKKRAIARRKHRTLRVVADKQTS